MVRRLAWLTVVTAGLAAAVPDDPRADPYYADERLRALMDWVTFQVTFDGGSLVPDMALGQGTVRTLAEPSFEPGVKGLALVAGEGGGQGLYPRGANAPLATRGAISVWVKPVGWTRVNAPNGIILVTSNASFYLQRQGPAHGPDGRATRHEGLQFIARPKGNQKLCMMSTATWPNDRWKLIVANWSWPAMSVSLDGGEFLNATHPGPLDEADFGDLVIGNKGAEKTVIDELTIYRRPLTLDEARLLYTTFSPDKETG